MNTALARYPLVIAVAAVLWAAGSLLRLVPLESLLVMTSSAEPSWFFQPLFPGMSLVVPLQALLLVFVLRRHLWSAYGMAALAAYLLFVLGSSSWSPAHGGFPLAAWKGGLGTALEVSAVVLLFTPSALLWFRSRPQHSAA